MRRAWERRWERRRTRRRAGGIVTPASQRRDLRAGSRSGDAFRGAARERSLVRILIPPRDMPRSLAPAASTATAVQRRLPPKVQPTASRRLAIGAEPTADGTSFRVWAP